MKKLTFLFCILLTVICTAQEKNRFENDVQAIRHFDKMYQHPENPIVFTGSSSIRKWDNLQVAFGSNNVINRGIGGAVIDDIIYYLDDLVFVHNPRQVVIYVGENDLVNDSTTPEIILAKTSNLFKAIRAKLPQVPVVYIAMKPSPSRDKYQAKCIAANELIRKFLATEKNVTYIDVFSAMLTKDKKSRPELFVGDMLHLNQKGYAIWEKLVAPHLIKQD